MIAEAAGVGARLALFPQQANELYYENERDERIPVHAQGRAPLDGAAMTTIEVDDGDKAARAVPRGTDRGRAVPVVASKSAVGAGRN